MNQTEPPTPEPIDAADLASRFAALADESRIRLLGLLARRPHYGEELAEFLGLSPATISHHLRRLREVGLVRAEKQSPYVLYWLRDEPLTELGLTLRSVSDLPEALGLPTEEELSAHILRRLLDENDRLHEIPTQRRQRSVLLRHLAHHFETGRIYPEREIRRVLLQFHDDSETLMELMIDAGWLQRSGSVFRRLEEVESE
jgi:biotin operon repressor